jgi:polysaccharide export outer membrane protein
MKGSHSYKSMPSFTFLFFLIGIICTLSSCSSIKTSYYFKSFQRDTTIETFVNKDLELKIRKGDNIVIQVSSLDQSQDALYNSSASANRTSELLSSLPGGSPSSVPVPVEGPPGYKVDSAGNILLHTLGSIHVEGMTLKELQSKLQNDLLAYLKEPIVYAAFANHKVTIFGDVVKPQVLEMPEEPLTLLDALTMSGDIQPNAEIKNVLIIRDSLNNKKFKHINMEEGTIFNSPWYYLQPNDIVYVEPNAKKIDSEARRAKTAQTIAIVSSILTILIIVLDRIN